MKLEDPYNVDWDECNLLNKLHKINGSTIDMDPQVSPLTILYSSFRSDPNLK